MKMQFTLFALAAIAAALSWAPAADAHAHGFTHSRHHNRMVNEKRQSFSGKATFYNTETGNAGSCGDYLKNTDYVVAVNAVQYNQAWCGRTITVHANGKSHSATIKDECPGDGSTCKWGALDMSPALFEYFADKSVGVIDISWGFGGAIESAVNSLTGGGNKNQDDDDDDDQQQQQQQKQQQQQQDEENKKQAAASKAAAASSSAAAAYASSTAAAASASASQASASSAARASATSAAAASSSKASASASRASVSEHRASVASVHRSRVSVASVSRASVASVSKASVASVSRASASSQSVAKSSSSAAAAAASVEAARPKNLENFDALFGGLQQLAMVAQN